MNTKRQLNRHEWPEMSYNVDLCVIDESWSSIEFKLGMVFDDFVEDGLGPAKGLFLVLNNCFYYFRELEYLSANSSSNEMSVFMLSFEPSPLGLLATLRSELKLRKNQFKWIRSQLGLPQWEIWEHSKQWNGKRMAFHEEYCAKFVLTELSNAEGNHFEIRYVESSQNSDFLA